MKTFAERSADELLDTAIFLLQRPVVVECPSGDERLEWKTDRVFLTREYADAFAHLYRHRYPDGWRVHSVPCGDDLARAIRVAEAAERLSVKIEGLLKPAEGKGGAL